MRNKVIAPLLSCLLATSAALAQPLPTVAVPQEVEQLLRDYARAWAANDVEALARLFAPDGMALPNGQPAALGAERIRKAYAQAAGMPLALRALAFGSSGELGYVIGGFGPAPGQPDFGKFTLVLRRGSDGRWLIVSDMDNSNAPLPPAPQKPAQP